MTLSDLEYFRNLLAERQQNVVELLGSPGVVTHDDIQKAQAILTDIKEALGRVEHHSFGTCVVCQGEIEHDRLEIQPVVQVCLDCISQKERTQLEEELFLASKIHRALLPQSAARIEGFDMAVRSLAASMVGGDYYDFLPPNNGGPTRIVIADTMGKGLPAGLLMSNIQGVMRILSEDIQSPLKLVSRLNQWLCHNVQMTKFISLICVALENDRSPSGLTYTNAGHCPGILIRNSGIIEQLEPTGGVLGVHDKFLYEEKRLDIFPGDLLLFYTDGVSEAKNRHDEEYGEGRITAYASAHREDPLKNFIDGIINEVQDFSGLPEFEDDFTLMVIRNEAVDSRMV